MIADTILAKIRRGEALTEAEKCAGITSETELEQYRLGLRNDGRLDADALKAIEVRRHALRKAKGVRL